MPFYGKTAMPKTSGLAFERMNRIINDKSLDNRKRNAYSEVLKIIYNDIFVDHDVRKTAFEIYNELNKIMQNSYKSKYNPKTDMTEEVVSGSSDTSGAASGVAVSGVAASGPGTDASGAAASGPGTDASGAATDPKAISVPIAASKSMKDIDIEHAMHEDYDAKALLVEPLTGGYDMTKKTYLLLKSLS